MERGQLITQPELLDRYELLSEIARGGMASVWLARLRGAAGFQRLFAVKRLHPHVAQDAQFVAMLLDEARLAARIHHPNAVEILDVCRSDQDYCLVMPYVEGVTLQRLVDGSELEPRRRTALGLRVLCDALAGLHAAHELKGDDGAPLELVHRDVSPQNILVGLDGIGRIADFGIARAAARLTSTRPGMLKGKPCYMAPEQARSQPLDRRADVFAAGVVLWETLTGERLFFSEAGDVAMLVRVMSDPVPPPSTRSGHVTQGLDAVCLRALDKDPAARHATARELGDELERAARDAGLLPSAHEVGDHVTTVFGAELRARRVRLHEVVDPVSPTRPGDDAQVPVQPPERETSAAVPPTAIRDIPAGRASPPAPPDGAAEHAHPPRKVPALTLLLVGLVVCLVGVATYLASQQPAAESPPEDAAPLSAPTPIGPPVEPPSESPAAQGATGEARARPRVAPRVQPAPEPSGAPERPSAETEGPSAETPRAPETPVTAERPHGDGPDQATDPEPQPAGGVAGGVTDTVDGILGGLTGAGD